MCLCVSFVLYCVMLSSACVSALLLRLSLCSNLNVFVWFVCDLCCVMCLCVVCACMCVFGCKCVCCVVCL